MKKQILILVSVLLCNFGFSQTNIDGYPLDVLKGTYTGHKYDFTTAKMDASKEYKITIADDFIFSIETKINGSWRQLLNAPLKAESAKESNATKGVSYLFEMVNSSDYKTLGIATVNESLLATYKKGIVFTLTEKNSNNIIMYTMNKEGGNPNPQKYIPPPPKKRKKKRRVVESENGFNYSAAYSRGMYSLEGANTVLERYNETNADIIESPMPKIETFHGTFTEFNLYNGGFFGAFNVTWEVNNTRATAQDNFGELRDYHFQIRHLRLGANIGLVRHSSNFLKWTIGGTFSGGRYRFFTGTSPVGTKWKDLKGFKKLIPEDLKAYHVGGFARVMLGDFRTEPNHDFRLFLQADYATQLNSNNLLAVNEAFNPTSFTNDDNENLNMKSSIIGIKFGLMIGLWGNW